MPGSAQDWWRLHLESWHPLGTGTDVPAPPYVLPLALVASFLGTGATISALLVLAVPLSFWGGWRFLRVVARLVAPEGAHRWLLLWGATTYALIPAASGAWGEGRFGIVAVTTLLPWLAHAALVFAQAQVLIADVVPRPHDIAAVYRHGLHRRVGKHEADRHARQIELTDDRDEIVAVGA